VTALSLRHRATDDGAAPSSATKEGMRPSSSACGSASASRPAEFSRGSPSADRPAEFLEKNLSHGIFRPEIQSADPPAEFSGQNSSSGFLLQEPTRGSTTRGATSQTRLLGEAALGRATRSCHFSERGADLLSECDPTGKSQEILENANGVPTYFPSRIPTLNPRQRRLSGMHLHPCLRRLSMLPRVR
jgi:hypothetical protein